MNASQELTAADRCDRCQAQAYLRVTMPESGLELLWCGHHADEHRAKLTELATNGAAVHDELAQVQRMPILKPAPAV